MGALIWVHHEGNTLLHTTSVLIFGNLVEDGVANVYLCVVDDNFNHSLLFFFVKLVLSCDNTLDDHVYKLSIGMSHCSGDDLSLLLLLLVAKHVLSSFPSKVQKLRRTSQPVLERFVLVLALLLLEPLLCVLDALWLGTYRTTCDPALLGRELSTCVDGSIQKRNGLNRPCCEQR